MQATCAGCGSVHEVTMVGEFRCEDCALAEVDADIRRVRRTALAMLGAGVGLAFVVVVLGMNGWEDLERDDSLFLLLVIGAVALIMIPIGMLLRYRPKLRR